VWLIQKSISFEYKLAQFVQCGNEPSARSLVANTIPTYTLVELDVITHKSNMCSLHDIWSSFVYIPDPCLVFEVSSDFVCNTPVYPFNQIHNILTPLENSSKLLPKYDIGRPKIKYFFLKVTRLVIQCKLNLIHVKFSEIFICVHLAISIYPIFNICARASLYWKSKLRVYIVALLGTILV